MKSHKAGMRALLLCSSILIGGTAAAQTAAPAQTTPTATPAQATPAPVAQVDPQTPPTNPAEAPSETEGADIVVTGTRASLGRALDLKRATLGIVDAISAEDMGKFPDQNVAESLQRVPGVSIAREAGEGRFVTVRGFGPEFNTVLLNNRLLATDNAGREFSFDILPSELISGADVYKSSAANFQDGGIGSTVVIHTARPTDRAGLRVAGKVAGKYDSGSKDWTPTGSLLVSLSNPDRTVGVLASLVYDKRDARLKRYAADGWITNQNLDFNGDGTIDLANVALPRTSYYLVDTNSRERIGGTLAFDWVVSDTLRLQFDGLYSQYKVDSRVNQLAYFTDPGDIVEATANQNNTVTHFVRSNLGKLAADQVVATIPRDARTFQLAGNAKWTPTDQDSLSLDASYSKAKNNRKGQEFFVVGYPQTGYNPTFDLRPDEITPLTTNVAPPTASDNLRAHFGQRGGESATDEIIQLSADAVHSFDAGIFKKVDYGVLATRRTKDIINVYTPGGIVCFYCGYYASVPANLVSVFNAGKFLGSPGVPTQWLTYDTAALQQYLGTDAAINQNTNAAARDIFRALYANNGNSYAPVANPGASGQVRETSLAYYAQAEFGGDFGDKPWSAVAGLRWVYTRSKSSGTSVLIASITRRPNDATQADYTLTPPVPVTAHNDYNYFLPSATFRLNLTDQLVGRLAVARTLTRPTLTNLAPTNSYSIRPPDSFVSSGGNPYLKPYLAWNYDASVDFYVNKASYFSLAAYYKKISNFIVAVTRNIQIQGFDFEDTRLLNQKSSTVYGAEATAQYTFDFLPSPLDGLGTSLNYTLVRSKTKFDPTISTATFNVEGLSDTANVVLFYEKGPVQIRGAYNWRQGFLRKSSGSGGQPENVDPYGQYDASASLKVYKDIAVFGEVQNITNAKYRAYQAFEERILSVEDSGRRIIAGVRATF